MMTYLPTSGKPLFSREGSPSTSVIASILLSSAEPDRPRNCCTLRSGLLDHTVVGLQYLVFHLIVEIGELSQNRLDIGKENNLFPA
jgi:hypothetical protein